MALAGARSRAGTWIGSSLRVAASRGDLGLSWGMGQSVDSARAFRWWSIYLAMARLGRRSPVPRHTEILHDSLAPDRGAERMTAVFSFIR